jgi:hypothetical protein
MYRHVCTSNRAGDDFSCVVFIAYQTRDELFDTMGSNSEYEQESDELASETGDPHLDSEYIDSTTSNRGKRAARSRGGRGRDCRGRGNGSVRKASASTATGLEANKVLSAILNASKVRKKTSLPAQPHRCWSWDHWRAVDAQKQSNSPVSSKYEALSKIKPLLQCCHCQKKMSWNPSTKRKQHLLASCSKFHQFIKCKSRRLGACKHTHAAFQSLFTVGCLCS